MSATTTLLTVEEFLQLPEKPGSKRELREGVVVEMGAANSGHEIVKSSLNQRLGVYLDANPIGMVFSESAFVLGETELVIPDVSLLLLPRLQQSDPGRRFQGAPDLAVEVVSSESASDLEHKIRSYLRHGARLVVVAYPLQRVIHTYDPHGNSRVLEEGQSLEIEFLPGFRMPVEKAFEGIPGRSGPESAN